MRIYPLMVGLLLFFCACENQITTIGLNFVEDNVYVSQQNYDIEDVATVKIDSFITSSPSACIIGKMRDYTTGTMEAIPHFHLASPASYRGLYPDRHFFDSLVLEVSGIKLLAGDSLSFQQFHLCRLQELPKFNHDDLPYDFNIFYNNTTIPFGDTLSTLNLYTMKSTMDNRNYFRLPNALGEKLFEMILRDDQILYSENLYEFIDLCKGLAILPGKNNNALISVSSTFKLSCYYHDNNSPETPLSISMVNTSVSDLTFNRFIHTPGDNNEDAKALANVSTTNPLPFIKKNIGVIQGLNGYMLKIQLPRVNAATRYETLIKAEIELRPETYRVMESIPEPVSLGLYETDLEGVLKGILTNNGKDQITGMIDVTTDSPGSRRFLIDITDFYNYWVNSNPTDDLAIYVGLPGSTFVIWGNHDRRFSGDIATKFDQLTIREQPKLILHYIKYK